MGRVDNLKTQGLKSILKRVEILIWMRILKSRVLDLEMTCCAVQ